MASTLTTLLYHIVFSTKNREPIITAPIRADLYKYIGGIVRGEGGKLLEIGGVQDHIHLVVRFKSDPSVATMVKIVKSKSSAWLNAKPRRPGHLNGNAVMRHLRSASRTRKSASLRAKPGTATSSAENFSG
jgi:REP element-mobilizing transposase RayT